jgi:tetratricopeptide (TPR) repeat protein
VIALARVAAVMAALAAVSLPAQAAPDAERQAKRSFQSAETHFRAGRFAEALEEYQAGYDKAPLPGFLINIAQCQRRLGNLQKARATYQKFVMVAPDSPLVPEVRNLIADLDKLIADLDDEKVQQAKDGQDAKASKDAAATKDPAPGRPEVEPVAAETVPAMPPTAVAPVESLPAVAPVLVDESPARAADAAPRRKTRWWLWGAIGAAVVGGSVAAFALAGSSSPMTVHEGTLGTLRR